MRAFKVRNGIQGVPLNINTSKNHSISNILKPFGFLPSLHQMTFVAKFCHLSSSSHFDWCNILKECKHGEITWDSLQKNQQGSVEPGVDACCISQPLGAENQPKSLRCYEEQDRKKWWKSRRSHCFGYLIVKSPLKLFLTGDSVYKKRKVLSSLSTMDASVHWPQVRRKKLNQNVKCKPGNFHAYSFYRLLSTATDGCDEKCKRNRQEAAAQKRMNLAN